MPGLLQCWLGGRAGGEEAVSYEEEGNAEGMTSFSKCSGDGCAVKEFCYRFLATEGMWQSYIDPPGEDEFCRRYKPEGAKAPKPEISEKVFQALTILRKAGNAGLMPKEFAAEMWPESDGWTRQAKCGQKGSHRGGGMYMAAGGFLGRLRKRGLVEAVWKRNRPRTYSLTAKGYRALRYAVGNRQEIE